MNGQDKNNQVKKYIKFLETRLYAKHIINRSVGAEKLIFSRTSLAHSYGNTAENLK